MQRKYLVSIMISIGLSLVFMGILFARSLSDYDSYSNEQLGLSFQKPRNWLVFIEDGTIMLIPSYPSRTKIFLHPLLQTAPETKALSFIRFIYDQTKIQHPDLEILDKRLNPPDTVAEVTAIYTDGNQEVKGFYVVSIDNRRGLFCGYEAETGDFDADCRDLRAVLKDFKILPLIFYQGIKTGQAFTNASSSMQNNSGPTIDINSLTVKLSTDSTMYAAVPPDWSVDGGNFSLICSPPDGKMGLTATGDHQPRTNDPHTYLVNYLMPFYNCTNTVVHKQEPNYALMKAQPYPANAVDFTGETTQSSGQKVYFWMVVNCAGGFVNTVGFYATPELFERNVKVLYAMTSAMGPNQEVIMGNLRQNLNRLDQASRTMAQTSDIVIQGLRSSTANWNRAMDKYNYYLSGEEARYSALENKIYVVDSNLESYASNPRYPQEMLSSAPDNLWDKLPHERNY